MEKNKKIKYAAYCIADKLDLNKYRQQYPEHIISKGSTELYIQHTTDTYMFVFSYGVVVFSGMQPTEIDHHLQQLTDFTLQQKNTFVSDVLEVQFEEDNDQQALSFDTLTLGRFDHAINKMIMMHLAQSVALDHYNGLSQGILGEIKAYTYHMQIYGKVKLSHKQALKFIGKTLNTKNSIAENMYILDSPEVAWEDEYLDRLHTMLVRHFELVQRYKEIDNTLKIIEDNLSVYISYNHHRESSRLEWIIIILIVIEVLDTFTSKFW